MLQCFGNRAVMIRSGEVDLSGTVLVFNVRLSSRIIHVKVDVQQETASVVKSAPKLDRAVLEQELDSIVTLYDALRHMGV